MRNVFIINPIAGKGKGEKILVPKIKAYFADKKEKCKIFVTKFAGEAKQIAVKEAQSGDEITLFSCGGEGTGFDILNGIIDYDNVTLGVIPTGSANDFLKYFGDENKEEFMNIDEQVNGEDITVDVIKADEYYCINGCSVGMDAVVARDMSIFKNWPLVSGPMAYKLSILKNFLSKIGITVNITLDGKDLGRQNCLFAVIANGPAYGGGYISAPDAELSDGSLDFTLVNTVSKLKVPAFLKKYKAGKHADLPFCRLEKCESMSFTADKKVPVNLDGEIFERNSMSFSIIKNKLKFRVPKSVYTKLALTK